jgi:4'-phosphopantetheinyl transferase EntD
MDEVVRGLRWLLPTSVALGQARLAEDHAVFAGEDVPRARPQRLLEFRAGRAAARRALAQLGAAAVAIPMGADRAPIWPQGFVGSISHCEGLCMALAAAVGHVRGLGLDVEPLRDLPEELWQTVLRPEEITLLRGMEVAMRGRAALSRFAAKEAVYKAQYPISKRLFDFQTIGISVENQRFTAEFFEDVPEFPRGTQISGALVSGGGFLAAWVILT